jgi:two-component system response regulator ResD
MKKILIIDDDEVFAKTLGDTLPKEKYLVSHVSNGEEGLNEMTKNVPDLIILDLIMPKLGGLDFLTVLKRNGGNNIPILISSQLSKMEDISNAIVAGMDVGVKGYIIKSSENLDKIVEEIEKTLGKYSK